LLKTIIKTIIKVVGEENVCYCFFGS